jgi:polysaccharide chain length determinant protein (PEP-CTERM system associated)
MKKSRLVNLNDYLAFLVRRRWWVIIPTLALFGLTILISLFYPKTYKSETLILLQSRDVPPDFVKDLIGGDTGARLRTIEHTILSRTNLLNVVREFENRLPNFMGLNNERKVEKLKKRIVIDFSLDQQRSGNVPATNIRISYRDHSPDVAQKITARLGSFFIEQDNRVREDRVFGTAEFLESELKKVTKQLQQSEYMLKTLKERYRYELPSELETNLRTLDRLQTQKNGNLEALDRYVTLQMNLERQISETPPMILKEPAGKTNTAGVSTINPLVESYRKKEQAYRELIARANPQHPDVRRLKAELEEMAKDIPPEDLVATDDKEASPNIASTQVPNPVYQNLTAQLRQLKTDIKIRERERDQIENEMEKYNQRIQSTPGVEQEMMTITRTNGELTKQYQELKTKLDQAKLAESLENRQKGSQFEIIDPASYPLVPLPPSRLTILMVGFGISLVAGVLTALVINCLNQQFWTHHELERALEVPVLVEIPAIVSPRDIRRALRRKLIYSLFFIIFAGVYLSGIYCLYMNQSTVLRILDPLIEKIEERAAKQ